MNNEALSALQRRARELEEENLSLDHLATVGELAGVLAHEFSDFLNMLLLQISVLEYRMPDSERADLAEVRRHGHRASELVNQFQQYRHATPRSATRNDLAEVAREASRRLTAELAEPARVALRLRLGEAPPVAGSPSDLRRLVRFLIANAVRASGPGGEVVVAVDATGSGARLCVEDSGVPLTESEAGHLFSPASAREGVDGLEMAACRSLARRLRARLVGEARDGGGARVLLDFEAIPS